MVQYETQYIVSTTTFTTPPQDHAINVIGGDFGFLHCGRGALEFLIPYLLFEPIQLPSQAHESCRIQPLDGIQDFLDRLHRSFSPEKRRPNYLHPIARSLTAIATCEPARGKLP
jgi:hypothetical protein